MVTSVLGRAFRPPNGSGVRSRRGSVDHGPHRVEGSVGSVCVPGSVARGVRVCSALAAGRIVGWLSVSHLLRVMSRRVFDDMQVSLSRRWTVAAVLAALSVSTVSSAIAAVSPTTLTVHKTVPTSTIKRPARATALKISAGHATVTAKGKFKDTITGTLTAGKVPLAGQKVLLQERKVGARKWMAVVPAGVTGKSGHVGFVVTQSNAREQ